MSRTITAEQATRAMESIHALLDELGVPLEMRYYITVEATAGGQVHIDFKPEAARDES